MGGLPNEIATKRQSSDEPPMALGLCFCIVAVNGCLPPRKRPSSRCNSGMGIWDHRSGGLCSHAWRWVDPGKGFVHHGAVLALPVVVRFEQNRADQARDAGLIGKVRPSRQRFEGGPQGRHRRGASPPCASVPMGWCCAAWCGAGRGRPWRPTHPRRSRPSALPVWASGGGVDQRRAARRPQSLSGRAV